MNIVQNLFPTPDYSHECNFPPLDLDLNWGEGHINKAALFPGLEGFAASLGIYHPLAFTSGQNS